MFGTFRETVRQKRLDVGGDILAVDIFAALVHDSHVLVLAWTRRSGPLVHLAGESVAVRRVERGCSRVLKLRFELGASRRHVYPRSLRARAWA